MDTVSNYTETLEKTVRDLLERQDDLIRTAFTDQLTGPGNRGGFARPLEELWEQELPVTMAFIDIDNLKHCNDVFGHDEGNRYILQASLYLKLYMKVDEAAFRIGGDEFAILSTIATEDDLAERLEHCRTILLKNNDSEMPHSFSYGVSHADPALGEAPNRMTLDADHRMYDYKLRHAMHLDRRNITQVHTDDFEISDRVFDAFSMLNEDRYCFIENLDKHRTLWSQSALRDLGLPSEHIDDCHDYWKTRVHPDDLEAYTNDIDQIYNGSKHRRVMQYRMRNAVGDYVLCRARGFRIEGDGNTPLALCRRTCQPLARRDCRRRYGPRNAAYADQRYRCLPSRPLRDGAYSGPRSRHGKAQRALWGRGCRQYARRIRRPYVVDHPRQESRLPLTKRPVRRAQQRFEPRGIRATDPPS